MIIVRVVMSNHERVVAGLRRLTRAMGSPNSGAPALGRAISDEAVSTIKQLTPRARNVAGRKDPSFSTSRGFDPIWRGWFRNDLVVTPNHYVAQVINRAAVSRSSSGFVVVASLDKGARSHTIRPRTPGGVLAWSQSSRASRFRGRQRPPGQIVELRRVIGQAGGSVFTARVQHPGHRPFNMVRDTGRHIERVAFRMQAEYVRDLQLIFTGQADGLSFGARF